MISCPRCQERVDALEQNEERASDVYEVGNVARYEMGHRMYFASDGRTALCIAVERQED